MKLTWDPSKYNELKPMCMMLELLYPITRIEFFVRVANRKGFISVKKPAIQEAIKQGLYAWVDPASYNGKSCVVEFESDFDKYNPIATPATALEVLPKELITVSVVRRAGSYRHVKTEHSNDLEGMLSK